MECLPPGQTGKIRYPSDRYWGLSTKANSRRLEASYHGLLPPRGLIGANLLFDLASTVARSQVKTTSQVPVTAPIKTLS